LHLVADAAVSAGVVFAGAVLWRTGWVWVVFPAAVVSMVTPSARARDQAAGVTMYWPAGAAIVRRPTACSRSTASLWMSRFIVAGCSPQ
jgi:hypothetical protein